MMKTIDIAEVLKDLDLGYTIYARKPIADGKSIQEKYDLTHVEVTALFKNPKLVGRRGKKKGEGISFRTIDSSEQGLDQKENPTPDITETLGSFDDNYISVKNTLINTQKEVEDLIKD